MNKETLVRAYEYQQKVNSIKKMLEFDLMPYLHSICREELKPIITHVSIEKDTVNFEYCNKLSCGIFVGSVKFDYFSNPQKYIENELQ